MAGSSGMERTADEDGAQAPEAGVLFRIRFQKTRAAVFLLALVVGLVSWAGGTLRIDPVVGVGVVSIGIVSALTFIALAPRAVAGGWVGALDAVWMIVDPMIVAWGVKISGGLASPWYLWLLSTSSAAAFGAGLPATIGVAAWSVACYVGALVLTGDVRGLDAALAQALTRMAFLFGSSFFFLRGVAQLREKRSVIRKLREDESRKVEELRRLTSALDRATHELAEANARIREADRLKTRFLANMSHELRTPLNSIIGFSEILKTRLAGQVGEKHLRFLENINTSGHHLLGIINDILDLSKIEAGRMELNPEPLPVRSVVEGVCHVMKGMAAKGGVTFEVEVPEDLPPLEADPVKFKQILYNLLSNAVKFSPERSAVTISSRLVPADEGSGAPEAIEVAVRDRGIGIAEADRALIFEEFRQADGTATRRFAGTGLGLALVRKLVTLHGGTVDVESALGEGSTFTVTLPRRARAASPVPGPERALPPTSSEPASPRPRPHAAGRHKVLVVEDDAEAYEAIASALAEASFIPLRARSGEEAVMLAQALRPDAVTLDLVLPGLDGWGVLKALKGDERTRRIPVVIVSVVDSRDLGFALGADGYFLKPVDGAELVSRLEELLEGRRRGETTILVVDDDPQVHELLDSFLLASGFETVHALTGEEALERARATSPSLIVLDLMMDGMDGFEVASRLSEDPATSAMPILVLTARDLTLEDRTRLAGKVAALVAKGDPASTRQRLAAVLDGIVGRLGGEARGG